MFIQPVSMKIPSKQDYERDLKQQLSKLGYKLWEEHDHWSFHCPYLITRWTLEDNEGKQMGFNQAHSYHGDAYKIHTYNPHLFLALAGLTDDPIKVGDWAMVLPQDDFYHKSEKCPQKVKNISPQKWYSLEFSIKDFVGVHTLVRKATKEELIQQFDGVNEGVNEGVSDGVKTVSLAEKPVPKYKIGDKLRVTQNTTCHGFNIGENVTITISHDVNNTEILINYTCQSDETGKKWVVYERDLEPILTQIPKYFVVKRDDSPEWKEYITWLSNNYSHWRGDTYDYYGYHGANTKNGLDCKGSAGFYDPRDFKNNPQVFESAKEFMKLINNQPMRKITDLTDKQVIHCPTQEEAEAICKLMREMGKWIMDTAAYSYPKNNTCYRPESGTYADLKYWQDRGYEIFPAKDFLSQSFYNELKDMKRTLKRNDFIKLLNNIPTGCNWYQDLTNQFKDFAFKDELEVPDELYVRGRAAANHHINRVLDEIFGKYTKDVDLSGHSNDDIVNFLSIRVGGGNYDRRAFFLSPAFKWEITTDSQGEKVLVPTYK